MAKYAPLGGFLRRWKRTNIGQSVDLTFAEIERILGAILPKAASNRGWWQNGSSSGREFVQCAAWINAGFEASLIEKEERVRFVPKPVETPAINDEHVGAAARAPT